MGGIDKKNEGNEENSIILKKKVRKWKEIGEIN